MFLEELRAIPEQERAMALANIADDTISDHMYMRQLSDEELADLRFNLEVEALKSAAIEAEFNETKKEMSAAVKSAKKVVGEILKVLKTRSVEVVGSVYLVSDFELGRMNYVTPTGEIIYHRPLTPNERQGNVFKMAK